MHPELYQELESRGVPQGTILQIASLLKRVQSRETKAAIIIAVVKKVGARPFEVGEEIPGI